jgi:membrane-associated phospholipid phosphatase
VRCVRARPSHFPTHDCMPPLFAHDPFDAVQRAAQPGWLLAPATALSVACEYWVLALVALAAYAWLERDVPAAMKAFLPLALALAVGVGVVAIGARAGVLAGLGVRAVPSGHALWGATFAVYTFRVYGVRLGLLAALLPVAGGISRIYLGSNGVPSVVAGCLIGALIGTLTFEIAARVAPSCPAGLRRARHLDRAG